MGNEEMTDEYLDLYKESALSPSKWFRPAFCSTCTFLANPITIAACMIGCAVTKPKKVLYSMEDMFDAEEFAQIEMEMDLLEFEDFSAYDDAEDDLSEEDFGWGKKFKKLRKKAKKLGRKVEKVVKKVAPVLC